MHGGVLTGRAESVVNYKNGITNSVQSFFDEMLRKAEKYGLTEEKICLDPGFGFSKDTEQNTELLKNISSQTAMYIPPPPFLASFCLIVAYHSFSFQHYLTFQAANPYSNVINTIPSIIFL